MNLYVVHPCNSPDCEFLLILSEWCIRWGILCTLESWLHKKWLKTRGINLWNPILWGILVKCRLRANWLNSQSFGCHQIQRRQYAMSLEWDSVWWIDADTTISAVNLPPSGDSDWVKSLLASLRGNRATLRSVYARLTTSPWSAEEATTVWKSLV